MSPEDDGGAAQPGARPEAESPSRHEAAVEGGAGSPGASARPGRWIVGVLLIVLAQAALLIGIYALAAAKAAPEDLVLADGLTLPGETARLVAAVEVDLPWILARQRAGLAVAAETAEPGEGSAPRQVATATTDSSGRAVLTWSAPPAPGLHAYRVRVPDRGLEARAVLAVVPPDRPLALVSTAGSLLDLADPPSAEPAAEALQALARNVAIVWLETDARRAPATSRSLIGLRGFPPGPVQPLGRGGEPLWQALRRWLRERVRPRWDDPVWAVTTSPAEVEAFRTNGIRVLLVHPERPPAADGTRVLHAPTWKRAGQLLGE